MSKLLGISIFCALAILIFSNPAAATGEIDTSFNPAVTKNVTSNLTGNPVVQPDGKIILFGNFQDNSGYQTSSYYVRRVNIDGTPDTSFNCVACNTFFVTSVMVQTDGKIIVGGGNSVTSTIRLNTDGSQDNSFNVSYTSPIGGGASSTIHAIQPDGKILVRFTYSFLGGTGHEFRRLNTDGSNDSSFTPIAFRFGRNQISFSRLFVLPSGKLLLGGIGFSSSTATGFIYRYNSDGTLDTTFETPTFSDPGDIRSYVGDFDVSTDGSLIIPGKFTSVNSISRTDLARLMPAGNVDLNFSSSGIFDSFSTYSGKAAFLPNGQFIVNTVNYNPGIPVSPDNRLYRFNADGSLDNSYNPPSSLTLTSNWTFDSSNRIVLFGILSGVSRYVRLNTDGSLDTTFNPVVTKNGTISVLASQPDGKVLIGGDFDRINGTLKNKFARINTDGMIDNTFDAGSGFDSVPKVVTVLPDGNILVGGDFTVYNGVPKTSIVRLNSSGGLDSAFAPALPSTSSISAIALQTDGKILIGGTFSSVNGTNRTSLGRLNADGSLDNSFNPLLGNATILSLLVQSDGKIMVGGSFSAVNGFNRSNFVRLNADSSLDVAFNAGSISSVSQIAQNADGKYLVISGSTVVRRSIDGSTDASFQIPMMGGSVKRFSLQSDGSIVVGGVFDSINGHARNNFARLSSNGSFDQLFLPAGANAVVNAIADQLNGKIIVGGDFLRIGNSTRSGIALIIPGVFTRVTQFDYDGDGKADVSVFRPSENKWYVLRSSDFGVTQQIFAISGDIPVPADYDGDGKTDFAIFRPSSGDWWSLSSINNAQVYAHWGNASDITQPSDFDGDGRADYVVFRPAENNWYRISSANGVISNRNFGLVGDKPVTGDFDGDGKSDVAIFRPSDGNWWWQSSVDNIQRATHWGIATDIPVPADYDGDGKTDFAVYRPSTGVWYILNSSNGSFTILRFGIAEDKPVPADYDGDGKADIAVFRPSTGVWYLLQSTQGFSALRFGVSTDVPTPNAFIH